MTAKIPLLIIPEKLTKKFYFIFRGLSNRISRIVPGLVYDVELAELNKDSSEYVSEVLINTFFYFLIFLSLLVFLYLTQEKTILESFQKSVLYSILIFFMLLFTFFRYPKIIAGKKAEIVDKNLIFALKDLHLQVSSGITLYNGLVNVAKGGYGKTSKEFEKVAKDISVGIPTDKALEKMALHSRSDFLRRTTWQLINTLKAGASLEFALKSLIKDLLVERRNKIKSYIAELNLWILIYMFFSVIIPSIGITLLIVLSTFIGSTPSNLFFIVFIIVCLIVQGIIIGFIKTRRPVVHL